MLKGTLCDSECEDGAAASTSLYMLTLVMRAFTDVSTTDIKYAQTNSGPYFVEMTGAEKLCVDEGVGEGENV